MASAPSRLPSGTVTFVVTDIEGSTRLLGQHPDHYPAMLEEHRNRLRRSWSAYGGLEVDCQGDGSLVAFDSTDAAVLACAQAQADLRRQEWPGGLHPWVRMGVHTGVATPVGDRYISVAVHQATRISQAAHGGQVLVSDQAASRVSAVRLLPLGRYRVRDFDQPTPLHQLPAEQASARRDDGTGFPPPRCLPAERHNLPARTTRLIDRVHDIERLHSLVAGSRLVALVGAAGVGKTRLASELAEAVAEDWPDGVWLVDCAPIEDGALLPAAVGAALGLRGDQGAGAGAVSDLCAQLAARHSVLILDGCDRHLEATAHLAIAVLGSCPGMRIVVTSTEPLHVPGEMLHRLAPLTTDGSDRSGPPDAVALFLDRAVALRPELLDDPQAREAITAICRRLDGLPLAVEIAAARVSALHPVEILAGLDDGIRMLQVKDPTRPARQRGLHALLEWNFALLTDGERHALEQLSLLASSFDLDTARAAISSVDGRWEGRVEVGDLIWSLVDKSLLLADPSAGGTRYRTLETVRSYARGRLREPDDVAACAVRLATHYEALLGPTHRASLTWLHAAGLEMDNVRSVLAALSGADVEQVRLAQTLACTVARFHAAVQSLRVGITEVGALVARWAQPTPARVGLLTALGDLLVRSGEPAAAADLAAEAAALREQVGVPAWDEVGVEKLRGELALAGDRPEVAAQIAAQALDRPLGSRGRARMWNMLGIARATAGDLDGAGSAFRGELTAAAQEGDDVLLAHAHSNAAEVALRTGDLEAAARHERTCLEIAAALGQTGMLAYGLLATARIATGRGESRPQDWADAVQLVAKAEAVLAETGLTLYTTDSKVVENFLLQARERLGPNRYHRDILAGRDLSMDSALRSALAVVDRMASGGRAAPRPDAQRRLGYPNDPDTENHDNERHMDTEV